MIRHLQLFASRVDLRSERTARALQFAIPVLFGFWSAIHGVDANWDLFNYHLYNPFALLNGKVGVDLATAGFQTYFNPSLDLPYFMAIRVLPAPLVTWAMGALHGLGFVLLYRIARNLFVGLPAQDRVRVPLLLAIAGVGTAQFLSELGNTMGDNTTALLCLSSVLLVTSALRKTSTLDSKSVCAAGLLVGLATGLKLTNGIYAVALCVALLAVPGGLSTRVRALMVCALGVVAGAIITGGWWHYRMWALFGNPFFPQFGALFPNPLASSIGIADRAWLPRNAWEAVAWPFLFSLDSYRIGPMRARQAIWPLVYTLAIAWLLLRAGRSTPAFMKMDRGALFVCAFIFSAYAVWLPIFSIGRYLVTAELLAPLAAFAFLTTLVNYDRARKLAVALIGGCFVLVMAGGFQTWGHHRLTWKAYDVEVPRLESPAGTLVLLAKGDPPFAWLAASFSPEVTFAQLGGNFPEGPAFKARLRSMGESKTATFVIVRADGNVKRQSPDLNRGYVEEAASLVSSYGWTLEPDACRSFRGWAGNRPQVYQWCPARPRPG